MDITYRAEIAPRPADEWTKAGFTVSIFASVEGVGLDRPEMAGYIVPTLALAERMKRAVEAGAVHYDAEVRTDVAGKTYLSASSRVLGRLMNSDLRRLGF